MPPKVLAQVDIAKLGNAIAASVEKAKQEGANPRVGAQLAKDGKADMGAMEEFAALQAELEESWPLRGRLEEFQAKLFEFGSALARIGSAVSVARERFEELTGSVEPVPSPVMPRGFISGPSDDDALPALSRAIALRLALPGKTEERGSR